MDKFIKILEQNKICYFENFDLSQISAIKIGGRAGLVVFPANSNELEKVILSLDKLNKKYKVIGNASNLLFLQVIDFVIVSTARMQDEINFENGIITASAGVMLSRLCEFLKKHNFSGFEGLVGIPATIGGAIFNNAGAFGYNISDNLLWIDVVYNGKIIKLLKSQIKFGYHFSNLSGFIILRAAFLFENKNEYDIISLCNEYVYKRSKSQPIGFSLGSVFSKANGKSAGFYIERAGLKGMEVGGMVVSNKHANFFINQDNATACDFIKLASFVKSQVELQFGITLTYEIELVGKTNEIIGGLSYPYKKQ